MSLRGITLAIAASATLIPFQQAPARPAPAPPNMTVPEGAAAVEQTSPGTRESAQLVASFDGLGEGFEGPQGTATLRNPSDNSIAVGPNHIVQTVNSRMAIFTRQGKAFDVTGRPLYGPVNTNNVFKGFGGRCEESNNGDAVVRYDQLADRWLIVMPVFRRGPIRPDQPAEWKSRSSAYLSPPGVSGPDTRPRCIGPNARPPHPRRHPHRARARLVVVAPNQGLEVRTRCVTRSASVRILSVRTTGTNFFVRSFPTIHVLRSGLRATMCQPVRATM
jgi:hypothetical protein